MATATKQPGMLAAPLRQQQNCIDEMRASARMRARLMKKTPRPLEFTRGLFEVANPDPSAGASQIVDAATAAGPGHAHDACVLEEPSLPPADNPGKPDDACAS